MSDRRFKSLAHRLRSHGYSLHYVDRLTAELSDHFECLCDEHGRAGLAPREAADRAGAELGDEEELFQQIIARRHPSFVCRHPAIAFVLGPVPVVALSVGAFVLVGTCVFLGATRLLGIAPTEPAFRWLVLNAFKGFALSVTPVLTLLFCRVAYRHGLSIWLALAASLVLSAVGGFLLTDLVLCPASGNLKYFQRYGLYLPRVAGPLVVFILHASACWLLPRGIRRRGPIESGQAAANTPDA